MSPYLLSSGFIISSFWLLLTPVPSCPFLYLLLCPRCHRPLQLADNSSPRRLHDVRLTGEWPGTQKPHTFLTSSHPSVLCPNVHPVGHRQQPNIRVCVGDCVATHAARLLQVSLALLLHQWSQRGRVRGVVMLSDGDLRLRLVALQ